ncbi:MAG TPA: DUF190 domain-containing protein [Chloroflexia bacterium]|jgi:hypothetical protein
MNKKPGTNSGFERVQRLTIHIKQADQVDDHPLYLRMLELVRDSGTAGATVLKGVAGYSVSSHLSESAGPADPQQDTPLLVVIVDRAAQLQDLIPQLTSWVQVNGGMMTLEDLQGYHFLHPSKAKSSGHA